MSVSDQSEYQVRDASSQPPQRLDLQVVTEWCERLLTAAGLAEADARLVADSLVDAEARGISSHGVARTRIYTQRLARGLIDAEGQPTVLRETAATAHVDAANAIGHVGAEFGLQQASAKARQQGAGVAVVRHSNHCGTLGFFGRRAAGEGLIALVASNGPPVMVYFGGRTRAVGTNPLAIAVPRAGGDPLVLDMATSATARGRIILAGQTGGEIPEGWAVDEDGRSTTDAARALAGSVLPFAGPKGSGLAMMIELLCGGLAAGITGAAIGDMYEDWTREQRVSHFLLVLDPDAWVGGEAFRDHVAGFAEQVSSLPTAEGFERVMLPGEPEAQARRRAATEGVEVPATVVDDLWDLAEELGVELAGHRPDSGSAPEGPDE